MPASLVGGPLRAAKLSDQLEAWLTGGYHEIPLDREEAVKLTETEYVLAPK